MSAEGLDIAETRRKRDASLVYVDGRLAVWARWAKDNHQNTGLPTISTIYKAMMQTRVGIKHGALTDSVTAHGSATRSMRPESTGYIPEAVEEIDSAVARLPNPLRRVVVANYFTYGPIEVRAKIAGHKRARFSQLLEAAKYSVWVSLDSRRETPYTSYGAGS